MYNILGLPIKMAENILQLHKKEYIIRECRARFKDDVITDSLRVVKFIEENNQAIVYVSDFKTSSQSI